MISYKSIMTKEQFCDRVRWNLGVHEVFLGNQEILSPIFEVRFNKYIEEYLSEIENIDIENESIKELLDVSKVYYFCYLLCPGMYARLPERMENVSTKTLLQSIDWFKMQGEMLSNCNDVLDNILGFYEVDIDFSSSVIDLTDEAQYPNTEAF